MKPEEVFKRYDIRGKYPEEIDEEFARILGKAVGTWALKNSSGKVLVTKDTKKSSEKLREELVEGLKSTGVSVLDAGTGPTDYNALSSNSHEAVGIQITSSHLPVSFNGFKLIYPEGNGFVNEDLFEVQDIFRERDFVEGKGDLKGLETTCRKRYKERAQDYFSKFYEGIDRKIVYESMGGAGHVFLPELLEELGADLIDLSDSEELINPPDPKPENLRHVEKKVEDTEAEMGIVTDMDADRVAVYTDGGWLSGNEMFNIFSQIIQPEKIVASIDTASVLENDFTGDIFYTRVGDPFVISKALELNAELSGEPNGHYSFKDFVNYNSGTLAGLLIAASDIKFLRANISQFSSIRKSIRVEDKEKTLENLRGKVKGSYKVLSEVDGIKFRICGADVLVRSSGSSQKLRIISGAHKEEKAKQGLEEAEKLI